MKLTSRRILEIRLGISEISKVNKEHGFPIYDLGFKVNLHLAKASNALRPAHQEIEKKTDEFRIKLAEVNKGKITPKKDATQEEIAEAIKVNTEIGVSAKMLDDQYQSYLDTETHDVQITPISWDEMASAKCASPSPEVLSWLSPLFS